MVSVTSVSRYVTTSSSYQRRSLMYYPRSDSTELADVILIGVKTEYECEMRISINSFESIIRDSLWHYMTDK